MVLLFSTNAETEFLQFLSKTTLMFALIEEAVRKSKTETVIDLGSGDGGGLIPLDKDLKKRIPDIKIMMMDYFSNIEAFERTKKLAGNFE